MILIYPLPNDTSIAGDNCSDPNIAMIKIDDQPDGHEEKHDSKSSGTTLNELCSGPVRRSKKTFRGSKSTTNSPKAAVNPFIFKPADDSSKPPVNPSKLS